MSFSIIVAMDENNGIGKNNKLLAYLPNDLKWFKKHTVGHTVIMGRKTYQSLPNGALPKRRNIVLSKTIKHLPDAEVYSDINQVLEAVSDDEENFVIGGAQIFKLFLPITEKLYVTRIHYVFDADTFFPAIDWKQWEEIERIENYADERHKYDYTFFIYRKKH